MNIAFVTTDNAKDVLSWSGLNYYMSQSFQNSGVRMEYIDNLKLPFSATNLVKKIFYSKLLNKQFPLGRTIASSKSYSQTIANRLLNSDCDCIFSTGTIPIAYLNAKMPKVFYTDATFASMLDYYPGFSNLAANIIRQGHQLERDAIASCALAIYSSDWAAKSAIHDYGADPAKVKVVPFGANWDVQYPEEEVSGFINNRSTGILKILFNGVDWVRKGGDLLLSTAKEIVSRGINLEVHIVGIRQIPVENLPDYVINHGFLNKSVPREKFELEKLYKEAHFLFVPSLSEAFGLVFCEASLFGVPSISRKTGGVESAIIDGKNGFTLTEAATAGDYADLICYYYGDYEKYISLAITSRCEYIARLNWKTACNSLLHLIKAI